jgi:hypothetical protein
MQGSRSRAADLATHFIVLRAALVAAVCGLALTACNQNDNGNGLSLAQPHGATVVFDSIDGPPVEKFRVLVKDLNDEARSRNLAVLPRDSQSAYRVRGYLATHIEGGRTTVSWVWDVFDRAERRAFRISGSEGLNRNEQNAWNSIDDAMLARIARESVERLAAFLTSPDVAPGTPSTDANEQVAGLALRSPSAAPRS